MKNRNIKNAFSLLEFSIYLFGFILFVQMVNMFIAKIIQNSFVIDLKLSRLSVQQTMQATLYADGSAACTSLHFWFTDKKNQCYIWRTAQHDVCWEIKKGDLVRSVGVYDYIQKKWKDKKTSRMLLGAHTLVIDPVIENNHCHALIYKVHCNICDSQKQNKLASSWQKGLRGRIELKNRTLTP